MSISVSVVAGCLLFNGVLLSADTRATYPRGQSSVYVDHALKLFSLAPGSAIGYVGSIGAAAYTLAGVTVETQKQRRRDPANLRQWLPRFLRYAYKTVPAEFRPGGLTFMLASSFQGRPNVVDRRRIGEMLMKVAQGRGGLQSAFAVQAFMSGSGFDVTLEGTAESKLCIMRSPNFEREECPPLKYVAIGSGWKASEDIKRYHDMIVMNTPGQDNMEAMSLVMAVRGFAEHHDIDSVGGLYVTAKVVGNRTRIMSQSTKTNSAEVRIIEEGGYLVQEDLVSGKRLRLLPPSEIFDKVATKSEKFDFADSRKGR